MSLLSQLESLLFVAEKALSPKDIAAILEAKEVRVQEVLELLETKYNHDESGIHIFFHDGAIKMGTNPQNSNIVEKVVKAEIKGDLTKAQLETLTVIAYKGPVTKPELEQIRGVNCAVILRNLHIRGLIEEQKIIHGILPAFVLSFAALSHLGITQVSDLPEYETLSTHEHITQALEEHN